MMENFLCFSSTFIDFGGPLDALLLFFLFFCFFYILTGNLLCFKPRNEGYRSNFRVWVENRR